MWDVWFHGQIFYTTIEHLSNINEIEAAQSLYFTTPTGGLNSTKTNLAEDMSSEAANLIGSLSRHTEDSLNIENLNIESRQNLYGPELDIRPLEIPGAVIN